MTDGMRGRARRLRWRFVAAAGAAIVATGVVTGVALARSSKTPIGTGVVLINTQLGLQNGAAAGTGMVLTSSGEILTNNHVIRGATTIKVVVPGTTHSYTAKVVGYDVSDDVAVLRASNASNLKTVSTSSAKLAVGQSVTAVGNANGAGTLARASGRITGLRKAITVGDDQGGSESLAGLIETDAALEPGDSGGPLLNSAGKVIGMDTAASTGFIFRSSTGSDGYAIPIARALSIVKQIDAGHASARVHVGATAFLGIQVQSADGGILIAGVVPNGPADSAGLVAGDVITAIDGQAVTSAETVPSVILAKKPGATVTVTYTDQFGASQSATVTLGTGPAQ
jgi:S1-C subfamily serine protease